MPPRLPLSRRPARRPPCFHPRPPQPASAFHTSAPRHDSPSASSQSQSHYETLALTHTATSAEIKRQFFSLSKRYHPDKNPTDPTASTRFVAISEAYHVLRVPEKRAQYDAQLHASRGGGRWSRGHSGGAADAHANAPQQHGSYSSHQSFAGSRPASGLNKKRSTFRGPPPSFYKAGGYGRHGAKRAEYAEYAHHHSHPEAGAGAGAGANEGATGQDSHDPDFGTGYGPGQSGLGQEVPHFDDLRHKRTHDNVNEHIYGRRRTRTMREPEVKDHSTLINFLLMTGVLGITGFFAKFMGDRDAEANKKA